MTKKLYAIKLYNKDLFMESTHPEILKKVSYEIVDNNSIIVESKAIPISEIKRVFIKDSDEVYENIAEGFRMVKLLSLKNNLEEMKDLDYFVKEGFIDLINEHYDNPKGLFVKHSFISKCVENRQMEFEKKLKEFFREVRI